MVMSTRPETMQIKGFRVSQNQIEKLLVQNEADSVWDNTWQNITERQLRTQMVVHISTRVLQHQPNSSKD